MKKGDILTLKIVDYAFEGKGIAKIDFENSDNADKKFIIFVDGAYPGDVVTAQVKKKKKSYAEANVVEVITKSDLRVEPNCKYYGIC